MKIANISVGCYPATGGIENSVRQLAHQCMDDNNEAFIISASNKDISYTPANISVCAMSQKPYKDGNVDIIILSPNIIERILSIPTLVYYIPKLRRYFYNQLLWASIINYKWVFKNRIKRIAKDADIIHCHISGHLGWAAYEAAKELGVPFVITPYMHKGQYGCGPADMKLYRNADAVIALLGHEKTSYLENGISKENIFITGLAPDLGQPKFAEELKQKHNLIGYKTVTFLGRKQKYKGILELRQAADKVWDRFPKTKFLFIGPDYKECAIDDKDERIINLPAADQDLKSSYLSASDIICLPSSFESFGIVVVEAWAFKKPIIVSDNESLKSLVQDGVNGLVAKIDKDSIAQAIIQLLESQKLAEKLSENGFKKYNENYTPRIIYEKILGIYKEVLSRPR